MAKAEAFQAFMANLHDIREMLADLNAKSDDHFGVDPDSVNWAHVGDVAYIATQLRRALGRASSPMREIIVKPECRHSWVAGMMYVADEDLDTVSATRTVECEKCETVYEGIDNA